MVVTKSQTVNRRGLEHEFRTVQIKRKIFGWRNILRNWMKKQKIFGGKIWDTLLLFSSRFE